MTEITIGCDLGDRTSSICAILPGGELVRDKIPTERKAFEDFFSGSRFKKSHVVLEVGQQSRWTSNLLRSLGHQVTIANPRQVQLITKATRKSDRRDAEMLARLGRVDSKLLAPVEHRGDQAQAHLAIAKSRDTLVQTRTKLINMVRGSVKQFGVKLPSCTSESFHRRTLGMLPAWLTPALEAIYEILSRIHEQIRELDKRIEKTAEQYPATKLLTRVNGVGTLTAFVFVLTIENNQRFARSRTVGAYLGLTPRRSQSGEEDPQLPITKTGDALLRRLLVSAANYTIGPFGKDSDLKRFGQRLIERGGKNARRRAKVAIARRLAVLLHALWRTGEEYVPIGYSARAPAVAG